MWDGQTGAGGGRGGGGGGTNETRLCARLTIAKSHRLSHLNSSTTTKRACAHLLKRGLF